MHAVALSLRVTHVALMMLDLQQDRAVSPAQSFISIPESEAGEEPSDEDLQAAVEALSDEDLDLQ